jgi:BirA family transcriptional regulator, biotin operon repressor / biotin---[acetyl-CoA-carboxylase] ligase
MLPVSSPAPADIVAACNRAARQGVPLRLDVRWYPTVTSTMDVAEEAAQTGGREGVVIVAEEQTKGRGRRGRIWSSPAGAGLYVTFVFRPALEEGHASVLSLLTLAAGVAVRDAITQAAGVVPELKWPNDVMVGRQKLAGILCEGFGIGTRDQTVLVGIGINVGEAAHPPDVASRTTSLEAELGRPVERATILEAVLITVPRIYDDLQRGKAGDILRAWRVASPSAVNRRVEWRGSDGTHRGVTAGVDESGALLVRTASGVERVLAGELAWM